MIKQKQILLFGTATLLLALAGCGRCIKYGEEITEVRGWEGSDGTILYFTQLDYTEVSSKNPALNEAVTAYVDGVIEDFYRQDDNLAIAEEDYVGWDEAEEGKKFPTATVKEFEDGKVEAGYYDVLRIITESDKPPYISFRVNRITYSSKNHFGASVETATFDAETGKQLSLDDIFTVEQTEKLHDELVTALKKEYGEDLRDNFEDRVDAYKDGFLAKWYIEKGDFTVFYSQGSIAAESAGEPEVHVAMPK